MFKKIVFILICGIWLMQLYGCIALLAGAAGGAGTAAWLSGKLSQDVNAPYERTIDAAKAALKSLKFEVAKETHEQAVTQLKSYYTDGKDIWIDIRRISNSTSKVEVRVGMMSDKDAADMILKRIIRYL